MKPLIVSFHTGEERYIKDAERLMSSAEKFGYERKKPQYESEE